MIGHFLERDKHLAPANKARMLFEETRSEQAQKARNTLRRRYALQEMVSNTSIQDPSGANSFLSGNMDFVILAIGCVFCVLFMVFLMLLFYLCCHRRSKSGKMSGFSGTTRTTISLIFADSLIHPGIPTPKRTAVAQHRPVKIFESLQSTEL
uniref:Uncharacterized protein n=1 Tax=Acrobeloides nanus TaxID=290746 RepID=A0A914DZU5_9BILA